MRCAIYGAGSLGTVLGAYMTKNGVDVELINRNKAHVETMKEKGAHITGTVEMTVPVKALTPDEMSGKYDVFFLMTKQLLNAEVVTFLKPFLTENGVIVTLQNGIPEPSVAEIVGKNHTMGCVVEWGATLSAPGESTLTSEPEGLSFHMGKMEGITDAQFERVKGLLEKMCPVHFEENLLGARWSKLLINATFSGLGTVVGGLFGDVSEDMGDEEDRRTVHEGVHRRGSCRRGGICPRAGQGHHQAVLLQKRHQACLCRVAAAHRHEKASSAGALYAAGSEEGETLRGGCNQRCGV